MELVDTSDLKSDSIKSIGSSPVTSIYIHLTKLLSVISCDVNDVSPWRQYWLNQTFPDNKTKFWTESKAAIAMHNRSMGNLHNYIHDFVGDKIIEALLKEK